MNDADKCRTNGWTVGTQLVGDEGDAPTVIELTAVGEERILAKRISEDGVPSPDTESLWTLGCRDWAEAAKPAGGK